MSFMTLLAKLTLDSSDFDKGLSKAQGMTDKIAGGIKTAFKTAAIGIGAATTAVGAFATSSVKAGLEFDATMSEVSAISGATGEDFDALRQKAQEMGASTKFSASESAEALTYMAMAGWKTEDMLSGIEGVMNLAAASGADLATTSDIVTDALTAFGMSAQDSAHFADILAAASSNANTNVLMLGESFKYVAPVAGAMGYSAEDVSVALGLMANSGIKASQAGTALRTLLTNMTKPTDQMSEAMETLGISLSNEEGEMLSFMNVMRGLRSGFGKLKISEEEFNEAINELNQQMMDGEITEKEYQAAQEDLIERAYGAEGAIKAEAAAMLAGKEGMSGLLAIVNASEDDFDKLTNAINGASNGMGAASEMSAAMQNNLLGDITSIKSAFEGLQIAVSDKLSPSIRTFVKSATARLRGLTKFITSGGLDEKLDRFSESWQKIKTSAEDALSRIKKALSPIINRIKEWVSSGDALEDTVSVVDSIANGVAKVAGFVATAVEKGARFVEWLNSGSTGANAFKAAILGIVAALTAYKAVSLALEVAQKAVAAAQAVMNAVMSANPIGLIIAAVAALVAAFIWLWNNCEGFREFWINLWEAIKKAFNAVVEWLDQAIKDIVAWFTQAWEDIKSVWSAVAGFFSAVWEAIKGVFNVVGNWFREKFETARDNVHNAFKAIGEWFGRRWTDIKNVFESVGEWFQEKFQTAKDNILNVWSNIKEKFDEIWAKIKSAFDFSDAWNWGRDMIDNFIGGIQAKWEALKDKVSSVGQTIKNLIGFSEPKEGPLSNFHTFAPDMMNLFIKGITDNEGKLRDAVESAFDFTPSITGGVGKGRGSGFSMGGMTVNVYGSDGMSVRELADEVERRIVSGMRTLSVTYA